MRLAVAAVLALSVLPPPAASSRAVQRSGVPRDAPVPFKIGETLTYDVSWSSLLVAGTAVATVKERRATGGSSAYYIVADGRPLPLLARLYALYYRIETFVDPVSLLSQQGSFYTEEANRRRTAVTTFDRGARKARFAVDKDAAMTSEFAIPTLTQDGLSALYAVRALALRPGARLEIPVANDGELYTVGVEVGGPERVRVPLGEHEALVLRLNVVDSQRQPAGRNMAVWLSTDPRRLPVKLQAELPVGNFVLALREAR